MKFSMNGFRRNMSNNIQELRDIVEKIIAEDFYDEDDLKNIVNEIICNSNCLNCVYVKDDPEFVEMAHLCVKCLDDDEEDEDGEK